MAEPLPIPVLERLFRAAERRAFSVTAALATPVWVALVRMLLERFLSIGAAPIGRPLMPWFAHIVGFYVALQLALAAALVLAARVEWKRALKLVGMGLVLGTLPPFIDAWVYGRGRFSYEYAPGLWVPWTLHLPPKVLPWGETLVLWATVALMAVAALRLTRSPWRALLGGVLTYGLVLVFLVGLPLGSAWLSRGSGVAPSEWRNLLLSFAATAGLVAAVGAWGRVLARTPQILLAPLFALAGGALAGTLGPVTWMVAGQLALASLGFALANDFYDRAEDQAQGRESPVDEDAAKLLSVVPLVFALHLLAFRLEVGLCLLGFAVVSHAYHADPLRLKCVFPLSYKTEGLLGGLALVAGLTAAPEQQPTSAQLWLALLVAVGTPAALVFKDLKDVDADAAAGVRSAFVVAEAHGWPRARTKAVAAALLFVSLALPALWLWLSPPKPVEPKAVLGLFALAVLAPALVLLVRGPKRAVLFGMVSAEAHLALLAWTLAGGGLAPPG